MTFSHLNEHGQATMVDVSEKQISYRTATARSIVSLPAVVLEQLTNGDIQTKKGSVFQTAIIAGIMAPTAGQVEVSGKVTALLELGSGFNTDFTGLENIYLGGGLFGLSRRDIATKIESTMQYPGTIKVNVIRETRAVEFAK